MTSTVFIPQAPQVRDPGTGKLRPRFDLTKATSWGTLKELVGPSANPLRDKDEIIDILHTELEDYSDNDYILCVGNPILIGWTVAIAAYYGNGEIQMLSWNNVKSVYEPLDVQLW